MFGFKKKTTKLATEIDLGSEAFFQNPYPTYQQLRKSTPIAAVKPAGHILTRHADILEALSSPDLRNAPSRFSVLNQRNISKYEAARLANNILPFIDPPDNQVRRQCLIRAVRLQLEHWQDQLENSAAEQMSMFLQSSGGDLIQGFSSPLSLNLMCDFIGIEHAQRQKYKELSEAFFYLFAPLSDAEKFKQINATLQHFQSDLGELIGARATQPKDDLISKLLAVQEDGEKLSHQDVIDSCMLVFADGVENVEAGVANVIAAYYEDSAAQQMFNAEELSLDQLVSEGLRLQTPAQFVSRIANKDIELCGIEIAAETPIFLALASGNRDEKMFQQAEKILPGRAAADLLTFGRGAHSCIGSRLANLQISAAVKQVIEADLKAQTPLKNLRFQHRLAHRWPESYPVSRN